MKKFNNCSLIVVAVILLLSVSCLNIKGRGDSDSSRTTISIRLSDIEEHVQENPVYALNMVYIFKEIYSVTRNDESAEWRQLAQFENDAIENLRAMREKAVEEERCQGNLFRYAK